MNVLAKDKQIAAIAALAEGSGIRSIERMTGVHRDTVMRLGVRVGEACARLMDERMRDLDCKRIEVDEIWGFIGKKAKNVKPLDRRSFGDVWTFVAIDADTKLVPCYRVGKRNVLTAMAFMGDLSHRLKNRVQLSADALVAYVAAVEAHFGHNGVDFAQIVKTYSAPSPKPASTRYSPGDVVEVSKNPVFGNPIMDNVSTSYVERMNLTLRLNCRRLTRLTLGFSKKLENFKAAIGLNFAYYNFVKRHLTLGMTPAMAAGITNSPWTVADLVSA